MRGPVGGLGVAGVPFGRGEEVSAVVGGWVKTHVEESLIRFADVYGVPHAVVGVDDLELGAVLAVVGDFLFSQHAEACSGSRVKNQDVNPLRSCPSR